MEQLLLHLIGDYILQNEWMSSKKEKNTLLGYLACVIHCILYSLLFLLLHITFGAWLVIFLSHFLIDKYNLSIFWIRLVNWSWSKNNFGYGDEKPVAIGLLADLPVIKRIVPTATNLSTKVSQLKLKAKKGIIF